MKTGFRMISMILMIVLFLSLQPAVFAARGDSELNYGDRVVFGAYEQDGKKSNGLEDIQWIVLSAKQDKALLISRFALDAKPYNVEWKDMTWEDCTLRRWLNDKFYEEAFTAAEQRAILLTEVDNSDDQGNRSWKKKGGYNTKDKVFLLSYAEAYDYFDTNDERICKPTQYASSHDVWSSKDGTCHWWLRSPGKTQNYAAYCSYYGGTSSTYDYNTNIGVRPVIWVDLNTVHLSPY